MARAEPSLKGELDDTAVLWACSFEDRTTSANSSIRICPRTVSDSASNVALWSVALPGLVVRSRPRGCRNAEIFHCVCERAPFFFRAETPLQCTLKFATKKGTCPIILGVFLFVALTQCL